MIPLGRAGTPEEAAGAVYLFCIPESNYVSGQTLVVAGGGQDGTVPSPVHLAWVGRAALAEYEAGDGTSSRSCRQSRSSTAVRASFPST